MEIIGAIYYLLAIVPGTLQVVTFFILFGLLFLTKKFTGHRSAAALIGTGILLASVAGIRPYWILTHLLISGIGAAVWKRSSQVQAAAVAFAFIFFGLVHYEVANVKAVFPATAIWHVGERGTQGSGNPPERLVELKFGINHDQIEGRYSDSLADYLINRNVSTVPVEVPVYYSWGLATGMGVVRVDGKDFPTNTGGYGSWSADKPQAPFPKYFFGFRDFVSAK